MAKERKKSNFRDQVYEDSHEKKNARGSYGYLRLPKDIAVFSPEPGKRSKFDVIPYEVKTATHPDRNPRTGRATPGMLWYKYPFFIHRGIGGGDGETVVCPATIGKPCPICNARSKRIKEGADKKETDALKNSKRILYNVIPREHSKFEEKMHLFDISYYNLQNMIDNDIDENPKLAIFPDLEEGKTLNVRFASKTIGKSEPYAQADRIDYDEREPLDESIVEDAACLEECLNILSYEELEAKFLEMDIEPEGGELKEVKEHERTSTFERKAKSIEKEPEDPPKSSFSRGDNSSKAKEEKAPEEERSTRQRPSQTGKEKDRCPFGHRFGVDIGKFKDCDKCDQWDACDEEEVRSHK